ncbi:hypothetical protein IGI04_018189 [Brassica rapa subsp. trilocularis]|uniref:DUF4283 domain-containing protein n=1 Tax=Brassica rapa subsp. trilocularis TaxID=1813537 RepID=A0ABQ7MC84_BRACM|nr:hypothetical protein IGI04_018189 [Brassica rapa subsp. trilocularis]
MQNPWRVPGRASAPSPPSSATGDPPNLPDLPPDPPDPTSPLSPQEYPPLNTLSPSSKAKLPSTQTLTRGVWNLPQTTVVASVDVTMTSHEETIDKNSLPTTAPSTGSEPKTASANGPVTTAPLPPTVITVDGSVSSNSHAPYQTFTVLQPKHSSPILTNKASAPFQNVASQTAPPLNTTNQIPSQSHSAPQPNSQNPFPPANAPSSYSHDPAANPAPQPSLVERLRASEDKTLKRLAPVSFSESGRPRILIPDEVFKQGADLHKDFIICYYNGKAPPFNQIQSVLNHMWGKGKRLEMHNNPLNRSTLVRIPSEYLRSKILDKCIWYIGDSMFHTAQWSSEHSMSTPPLCAIKIWAHLTGVSLDLRYNKGLSLVAGLIGEPKETDDFTRNLVSLTVSHVKVEVDLTKPLPDVVEFERQNGEVVEVLVHYPWTPPTCSHCHELGHVIRNCLHYSPPKAPIPPLAKAQASSSKKTPKKPPSKSYVQKSNPLTALTTTDPQPPSLVNPNTISSTSPLHLLPVSPPCPRPSLKRSRSSPTFSPTLPSNSNPNPFTPLPSDPVQSLTFPAISQPPATSVPPISPLLCTNKFLILGPCSQSGDLSSNL